MTLPNTSSVVNFPIQEIAESTERLKLPDWELIQQLKIQVASFSNAVATGQITCEVQKESGRQHVRNANEILIRNGYKPFPIGF